MVHTLNSFATSSHTFSEYIGNSTLEYHDNIASCEIDNERDGLVD